MALSRPSSKVKVITHKSQKTRCRAKSNVSPPGCATSHWVTKISSVDKTNKKLVTIAMSLHGSKNKFQIDHLQTQFYQP